VSTAAGGSPERSGRLFLRRPLPSDLGFVTDLFSRPETVAHRPDPTPDDAEASARRLARDIAHWERHGFGRWAAEDDGRLIGFGGVTVSESFPALNLSYHLHPDHWGRGHAGEIVAAALSHAFGTLAAQRVVGLARPANPASCRVLVRAGFTDEGEIMLHGATTRLFGLDRRTYLKIRGAEGG